MKLTPQHLIDKHLRNDLSTSEQSAFDSEMTQNSDFASHVEFDRLVSEGLGAVRKIELKTRLEAISITPSWYGLGQFGSSTVVKSLGVFTVTALIGISSWLVFSSDSSKPQGLDRIQGLIINSSEFTYPREMESHRIDVPEVDIKLSGPEKHLVGGFSKEIIEEIIPSKEVVESTVETMIIEKKEESFVPSVEVPGLNDLADEKGLLVSDADLPEMSGNDELAFNKSSVIDVKMIYKKNADIKYKYFDGKLYLYGDFKSNPYEILEIHSTESKKLYLFHNKSFYDISFSDKQKNLIPINDPIQITELEIVRNNKR